MQPAKNIQTNHSGNECVRPWMYQAGREATILRLALVFLLIAILAGIFGFTWIEIVSIELARIAFFVFLVLFVIALIANATYRRPSDLV